MLKRKVAYILATLLILTTNIPTSAAVINGENQDYSTTIQDKGSKIYYDSTGKMMDTVPAESLDFGNLPKLPNNHKMVINQKLEQQIMDYINYTRYKKDNPQFVEQENLTVAARYKAAEMLQKEYFGISKHTVTPEEYYADFDNKDECIKNDLLNLTYNMETYSDDYCIPMALFRKTNDFGDSDSYNFDTSNSNWSKWFTFTESGKDTDDYRTGQGSMVVTDLYKKSGKKQWKQSYVKGNCQTYELDSNTTDVSAEEIVSSLGYQIINGEVIDWGSAMQQSDGSFGVGVIQDSVTGDVYVCINYTLSSVFDYAHETFGDKSSAEYNKQDRIKPIEDNYYYKNSNTETTQQAFDRKDGWNFINGQWYYYLNNKLQYQGLDNVSIDDKNYSFDDNGAMIGSGWHNFDMYGKNKWVYIQDDGSHATGWKLINGKWYYFDRTGYMYTDCYKDGYRLGSDGAMIN